MSTLELLITAGKSVAFEAALPLIVFALMLLSTRRGDLPGEEEPPWE